MPKQELTAKQREMLAAVQEWIREHGRPPTLREMAQRMGVASTNAIRDHLRSLEHKGYLKREARLSRGLEVIQGGKSAAPAQGTGRPENVVSIPLVGRVAAGAPVLAEENVEDTLYLDRFFVRDGDVFALQVKGNSMINAGIFEGDYVFVRQQPVANRGEIVVALIGDEATVKTYYPERGHVRLQPENDAMEPIIVRQGDPELRIIGKVDAVLRKM
ncbi:MAG: transcriptional repressor LexA [Chloroflexota bacterium]|nr:transcriptional repressor LexA [Chloroflexota bacterium]